MDVLEERKQRENQWQYNKWLSCGFKGEMTVNDCGWCSNGVYFEPPNQYVLFNKPRYNASIEYMRLPNEKWIAGSHTLFPSHGWAYGLSVWNKQYDTKEGAVSAEISKIEKSLDRFDKKKFVLDAIQACKNEFKESPVGVDFETVTRFEQISLF